MAAARLISAMLLAGVAAVSVVTPALAHAGLLQSSPAAGEVLPEAPGELRLTFSEPIEGGYTSIDLVAQDGTTILERAGEPDPADRFSLVVSDLPSLEDGAYTLIWRTLSAADGHTVQGFILFGVGEVELPAGAAGGQGVLRGELHPGHPAFIVAFDDLGRTATFGGLMLVAGLAVIGLLVLRPALGSLPGWVLTIQAVALAAVAAGAAITIIVNAYGVGGVRGGTFDLVGYVVASRTGTLLVARLVLAAVAFAAVLLLAPRNSTAALLTAGGAGTVGIALAVLAGHAAGYAAIAPVVVSSVHVAAAGIWLAGLVSLILVGLPAQDRVARMRATVPRFSALALAAIGLVAVTGAYNAWLSTRDLPSLATPYEGNLWLKVGLVGAALAIGLFNYLDGGRSAASPTGIRRRVMVEAGLAALVVLATANLTAGSPPAEGRPVPIREAPGSAAGGQAYLSLVPGGAGVNTVQVDLAQVPPIDATAELVLQRLDEEIGTTRLPLLAVDQFGNVLDGHAGHFSVGGSDLARHIARGAQFPAGSRWDAAVVVSAAQGGELLRRRFVFSMGTEGVTEGRDLPIVDPVLLVAFGLMGAGILALTYRLGGGDLPLTNPAVSRVALLAGGAVSLVLGAVVLLAGPSL
jgi:copper transport protein